MNWRLNLRGATKKGIKFIMGIIKSKDMNENNIGKQSRFFRALMEIIEK